MDAFIPSITYGATTFDFTLPINAFVQESNGIGNGDEAASGIGAAIEIRRDHIARVMLRFAESEYADVEDYVSWAQKNRHLTHTFQFDQDDATTIRTVRWHGPQLGTAFSPARRDAYLGVLEFEITLRRADGSRFDLNWSGR